MTRRLTRMYCMLEAMGDTLSAYRPPNIPPPSNRTITQGSRESPTQVNSNQPSPATHIHTTLSTPSTKHTAPVTPKAKRRRSWASDTDRYDSDTAGGDVSEQEHVRPNSDVFDPSPHLPYTTEHAPTALRATRKETLGAPTRCPHDDQEIVHTNRQKCRRRSHSSSCS